MRSKISFYLLMFLGALGLCYGWRLFWFLTDDAYISFRYVSNSILGFGYVWNAPPFLPVEGYTSFLWVVLLDIVWRVLGVLPPDSANYLSLGFSFLTLFFSALMLRQMELPKEKEKYRLVLLALLLIFLLTNRTFLAWSSSGLETAMFAFFVTLWVYAVMFLTPLTRGWFFLTTLASSLVYLSRPDGLLFTAATIFLIGVLFIKERKSFSFFWALAILPLLLVSGHLLWRYQTYGEWLPNTYYAKVVAAWPESGMRYAFSFVMEYFLWIWLAALLVWGFRYWRRASQDFFQPRKFSLLIVTLSLLAHFAYYTFYIGGDHFEYRVYVHFLPFIFLSFIYALSNLSVKNVTVLTLCLVFVLLSLPVPWTHWALTKDLNTIEEICDTKVSLSKHWPSAFRWYAAVFDDIQFWLNEHYVCSRHQNHKIYSKTMLSRFPTRAEGSLVSNEGFPVFIFRAVGVVSWVMPNVNIIDYHGLNDYVIARTPVKKDQFRLIAHERTPPPNYEQSYSPNVRVKGRKVFLKKRQLTATYIIETENKWRQEIKRRP